MMGTVLSNMEACFLEILYRVGWTTADANLWITAGLLPRLIRATMQWWLELHIHLQTISNANPEHWDEVVLPHIEYHSKNLARIRKWSLTRSMLVLQSYIYLRDGRAKGYQDIKLLSALTTQLQRLSFSGSHTKTSTTKPTAQWSCAHCHSDVHEGGRGACPMKDLKPKVARRIAKEAGRLLKTDPTALERLIEAERAHDSTE
jgi:hypothetical protein